MNPLPPVPPPTPGRRSSGAGGGNALLAGAVLVLLGAALFATRRFGLHTRPEAEAVPAKPFVTEFPVLGTFARLKFWAPPATAESAAEDITAELYSLHRTLNLFDPKSELSRLNRTAPGTSFHCSPKLWNILVASRRAWRETGGAFDVTVGPLMRLWGFHRKRKTLPTPEEVRKTLEAVGFDKLRFDDARHTVAFTHPGMDIDFGGIAKGYALDLCAEVCRKHGIQRGLIDLGGNIRCLEKPPPGRSAYEIGIRDPFQTSRILGTVLLGNTSVATSGDYEQFVILDGKRFTHIVDPRSGMPVREVAAVTVITPRGVDSDVFSTAIFVAGAKLAQTFVHRHPGSAVLRVTTTAAGVPQWQAWAWHWRRPPNWDRERREAAAPAAGGATP